MIFSIDECFRDHTTDPLILPVPVMKIAVGMYLFYYIYNLIIDNKRGFTSLRLLKGFGMHAIGFLLTFYFKHIIIDTNCSDVSNSVSGHTFSNVFTILFVLYLFVHRKVHKNHLFSLYTILLLALTSSQILETYFGGYHTIRQMLYGASLSIVFFILTIIILKLPMLVGIIVEAFLFCVTCLCTISYAPKIFLIIFAIWLTLVMIAYHTIKKHQHVD